MDAAIKVARASEWFLSCDGAQAQERQRFHLLRLHETTENPLRTSRKKASPVLQAELHQATRPMEQVQGYQEAKINQASKDRPDRYGRDLCALVIRQDLVRKLVNFDGRDTRVGLILQTSACDSNKISTCCRFKMVA